MLSVKKCNTIKMNEYKGGMTLKKLNNVRQVVNASGRMTKLGVSTPNESVLTAMNEGASQYAVMDELLAAVSEQIANLTGAEAACVVASASSGIVLTVASLIGRDNVAHVDHPYAYNQGVPNEVVLLKGHNINYGASIETMIRLGGGTIKEVGSSNLATVAELEAAISEQTIALFYVKSHHAVQKNMIGWEEMIEVSHRHNLPIIIDAAAEEDLRLYHEAGADYVIYSGTKALEGPTSGFVLTSDVQRAQNIGLQYHGIGRAMKVGKETLYGILQAVENYVTSKPVPPVTVTELEAFMQRVGDIPGLSATWDADEAGRSINRVAVHVDAALYGQDAKSLNKALQAGNPAIFVRDYQANNGTLSIDQRPLLPGDLDIIYNKLREEKRN